MKGISGPSGSIVLRMVMTARAPYYPIQSSTILHHSLGEVSHTVCDYLYLVSLRRGPKLL